MRYLIEHLEPRLFKWCILEYKHISKVVGKKNLLFSNLKSKKQADKLKRFGGVTLKSVKELKLEKAIVLDPSARKVLTSADFKKFNYLIFGGILGDYPPRKRTKKHFSKLPKGWIKRNLGEKQMSTDTAVLVSHMIQKGKRFSEIKFKDGLRIQTGKNEEVVLPYRYVVLDGRIAISREVLKLIRKKGF